MQGIDLESSSYESEAPSGGRVRSGLRRKVVVATALAAACLAVAAPAWAGGSYGC